MAGCSSRLEIDKKTVAAAFDETSLPYTVLGVSTGENDPQFYSFGDANPNAAFEIASMTKSITATAVIQLVEAGEIDLDVPVANYLPEINEIKILEEDLTTRQIIGHRDIKIDLSCFHELHHRRCGNGFGHRCNFKHSVRICTPERIKLWIVFTGANPQNGVREARFIKCCRNSLLIDFKTAGTTGH
jgi:hypothetical protein